MTFEQQITLAVKRIGDAVYRMMIGDVHDCDALLRAAKTVIDELTERVPCERCGALEKEINGWREQLKIARDSVKEQMRTIESMRDANEKLLERVGLLDAAAPTVPPPSVAAPQDKPTNWPVWNWVSNIHGYPLSWMRCNRCGCIVGYNTESETLPPSCPHCQYDGSTAPKEQPVHQTGASS